MFRIPRAYMFPILLGIAAFLLVVGPRSLDPNNLSWLVGWDLSQEYFGWAIFKNSPWTFPIGLNPNYGLEISSSIVYSDSIPILSLVFKLFAVILPQDFQFLGFWNLMSFILQAVFAWKLISLVTQEKWITFFAAGLFVFSPILFWKIPTNSSLVSQFLVVWAIYLSFSKNEKNIGFKWIGLLALSECIHFYIFAMIFALWLANLFDRLIVRKSLSFKSSVLELLVGLGVIFFVGWQVGYFAVSTQSAATGNYGLGAMNLLAPFDANGWSYLLRDIPQTPFNFTQSNIILNKVEGFNYLGLGVILALIFGFFGLWVRAEPSNSEGENLLGSKPFFWLALLILWMLALTNQVSIGPYNFSFSLPSDLTKFLSMFRASGRMFWPLYYVAIFLGIYLIIQRFPRRVALALIAFCLLIQIIDTSAGWLPIRRDLDDASSKPIKSPLTSQFWGDAAKRYKKIVHVPAKNNMYEWRVFARYAAQNKLATNSVFLSRVDEGRLKQANINYMYAINSGVYDPDTLYILESGLVFPVLAKLKSSSDLFMQIDGFNVLAPGWKICDKCIDSFSDAQEISKNLPNLYPDSPILFSSTANSKNLYFLSSGWGNPESWGTWSSGKESELTLPPSIYRYKTISIELRALVSDRLPTQEVGIEINQVSLGRKILTQGDKNLIVINLPKDADSSKNLIIKFTLPNAARPVDFGMTRDDERTLAIGIVSVAVN